MHYGSYTLTPQQEPELHNKYTKCKFNKPFYSPTFQNINITDAKSFTNNFEFKYQFMSKQPYTCEWIISKNLHWQVSGHVYPQADWGRWNKMQCCLVTNKRFTHIRWSLKVFKNALNITVGT